MIDTHELLSDDGKAVVMLCSHLALNHDDGETVAAPFTPKEWNALAHKIQGSQLTPRGLLGKPVVDLSKELEIPQDEAERIAGLLARGGGIALELEQLAASGIWCVTRVDDAYPVRIKSTLKHQAPPVLFGAGELSILDKPAIGIVGSRNIDEAGVAFARRLGEICARSSATVVSGGARGTDRISMQGSLEAGGYSVGVVADSLNRMIRQADVREFVTRGRLVLITPYRPDNGFSIGAAMGRNKVIYGASDFSVVVSSEYQKGGSWAGAIEALTAGWCPIFARSGEAAGRGNQELMSRGARALSDEALVDIDDAIAWMKEHSASVPQQVELLSFA
jgi:predicted Rossmann fold nucleotide-binding protein DprA/Smf involved in DNA uptake